jgi:hypothetical protein
MKDEEAEDLRRFEEIIESLPEEQQQVMRRELDRRRSSLVRATISQVMARNNSHNLGTHLGGESKKK